MIQLKLHSGRTVLYRKQDILAALEYERKDKEDNPAVRSIVTVQLWHPGNTAPVIANILVQETIYEIHNKLS